MMDKRSIVFVVLNYNLYETVLNCVASIQANIDTDSYAVVVVDNPSGSDAGQRLKEHFAFVDGIDVLCLDDNVGFAQGNNQGIEYARKKYHPDYVVCLNNDTLLEQTDFYTCLTACYETHHPAVIGPKIILRNGAVQPLMGDLQTIESYSEQLKQCQQALAGHTSWIRQGKDYLLQFALVRKLNHLRHILHGRANGISENQADVGSAHSDLILHGSCLIFTPAFFSVLKGFHPGTFMFREEELLYLALREHGLHNIYDPNLMIRHLEDMSTDSVCTEGFEKRRFLMENQIQSLSVLLSEIRKFRKSGGSDANLKR